MNFVFTGIITYVIAFITAKFVPLVNNGLQYFHMLVLGFAHMILTKEVSSKKTILAPSGMKFSPDDEGKLIVFVRHGESVWNEMFNRGFGPSFIGRLFTGLSREVFLIPKLDSVFFDTPLSEYGVKQAADLMNYLQSEERNNDQSLSPVQRTVIDIINGEEKEDVQPIVVASNLRRGLSTAVTIMHKRLKKNGEKLKILSSLQEISRNVDTQSILRAREIPRYSFEYVENTLGEEFMRKSMMDVSQSYGNKGIFGKGIDRQNDFCKWCFRKKENVIFVAGGHSLWFKSFFNAFLGPDVEHEARINKMVNCGVVAFRLHQVKGDRKKGMGKTFAIDPESIEVVYGGFVEKKGLMH